MSCMGSRKKVALASNCNLISQSRYHKRKRVREKRWKKERENFICIMAINKFHFIFTSTLRLFFFYLTQILSLHAQLFFVLLSHLHRHLRPPELLISWKCAENFSSTEIEINFMTRPILFSLSFLLGLARFHCLLAACLLALAHNLLNNLISQWPQTLWFIMRAGKSWEKE